MSPNRGNRFSGLVRTEELPDGCHARLLEPLTYTTKDGWRITAPENLITDYASIPRAVQVFIPPRGVFNRPAIIHDFLYRYAPGDPATGQPCTQGRADAILREACENCDDRFTQRWTIWLGLRLGGWVAWRRYRREQEMEGV